MLLLPSTAAAPLRRLPPCAHSSARARYDKAPAFELMIHSWDIGATVEGNASVCTKWDLPRNAAGHNVIHLLDVIKLRCEIPDVRALIKAHDNIDRPEMIIS